VTVFISVDMEGVAGIATFDQIIRGGSGYPRAQELMTAEANAAIAGAFDAGADQVVVNDSHGTMDNLLALGLDRRARLVIGSPKAQCMVQGLTAEASIALFVGYHAAAGSPGVLAHSFSSQFTQLRINGAPVSEAEVNAMYAASQGVAVGLVTGDDAICATVNKALPDAVTVPVKRVAGYTAADSLHPDEACAAIRDGAARAVKAAASIRPLALPSTYVVEIDTAIQTSADLVEFVPGSERVGAQTVRRTVADPRELMQLISAWYHLAGLGGQALATLYNRR
jgi:D-amino peptidase